MIALVQRSFIVGVIQLLHVNLKIPLISLLEELGDKILKGGACIQILINL